MSSSLNPHLKLVYIYNSLVNQNLTTKEFNIFITFKNLNKEIIGEANLNQFFFSWLDHEML